MCWTPTDGISRSLSRLRPEGSLSIKLPGQIVDPGWLEAHLGHDQLRTVDLRDLDVYEKGHLPGAVQTNLKDFGHSSTGLSDMLLPPEEFEMQMARLGISSEDTIVTYDDNWGLPAARLVWALHHYGHSSAAALDGGWDRWKEELRPDDNAIVAGGSGIFRVGTNPDVSADYDWLMAHMERTDVIPLDTRSQAEFDQGHLPGAICWDWFRAIPEESWRTSRSPDELLPELAQIGVTESSEVVTYCAVGMRSAHTYVVLRQAGFPRVRLYDGSWQDWSSRSCRDDN